MSDIEQALTLLAQASYSEGSLCRTLEWRKEARDLEHKVDRLNKTELEVLKSRNEFLEMVVIDQKLTIEALLMGCDGIGLHGSTDVLTYIARLEAKIAENS